MRPNVSHFTLITDNLRYLSSVERWQSIKVPDSLFHIKVKSSGIRQSMIIK